MNFADCCIYCREKPIGATFAVCVEMPARDGAIIERKGIGCAKCIINEGLPMRFDIAGKDLSHVRGKRVGDVVRALATG